MKHYFKYLFLVIGIFSSMVYADDITIDFEGLQNLEEIREYYNGGEGSKGSIGPDYNITFTGASLSIIDGDASGGTGNFANEPSPDTVGFFLDSDNLTMNVEEGFTKGFSFYYASTTYDGQVLVYDNYNATGKILKTLALPKLGSSGKGDPNGSYDTWATVSVEFDGIAKSVSFKGTANQIAFDNITLNPNPPKDIFDIKLALYDKGGLDAILHRTTAPFSNTFRIIFKIDPVKDDEGNDKEDISKVCENYNFKIEDTNNKGARQVACNYIPLEKNTWSKDIPAHVEVDFIINKSDNGYYFENGKLEVCQANDNENCEELTFVKDFTIYGTGFSITRDAFNFSNGSWNEATGVIEDYDTKLDFIKATNDLAYATDIVDNYITDYEKRESLWDSVGYELDIENNILWDKENDSEGLCFGMAFASIANFNHRNESSAWGNGKDVKTKWKDQIDNHWDATQHKAKTPFRPFVSTTYSYDKNNIEALKKIVYYFVTQSGFPDSPNNSWVGDYPFDTNIENLTSRVKLKNILKNGSPFGMRFSLKKGGGHAVVSTQFISYNKIDKWYIYDNNKPKEYYYYKINDNTNYSVSRNNKIFYGTRKVYTIKNLGARIGDDTSIIYANLLPSSTTSNSFKTQNEMYKTTEGETSYEYLLPSHIKIDMVGGEFKSIVEASTNKEVETLPYMGTLLTDDAYQQHNNIYSNSIYLPVEKIYKVTIKKDKDFPLFKLFGKIPNQNGTIEVVHYDNIESDANDSTIATFYIGTNNIDKTLKRDNASDVEPTNDESFKLKLTPVTNGNAIVLDDKVKLSWENPNNPNLEEIVIVRKENEKPTAPTDGLEVYRGTDEVFTDDSVSNNAKYFYAIYALSKDGDYTDPIYQFVDTYKYSIYGTIIDTNGNKIKDVNIELKTTDKLKTIDVATTDINGLFSMNDLTNGTYTISFTHTYYRFDIFETNVTVNDQSLEITSEAIPQPLLSMDMSNIIQVGDSEKISWNGQHISDDSMVNIKVYRNNTWEIIGSNLEFSTHHFNWLVTQPKDFNATIKVELASDSTVAVEKKVYIFAEDDTKYDFDSDGDIDVADIMKVVSGWNTQLGDVDYNSIYDFNGDNRIDIKDIMTIASKWGIL